MRGLAGQIGGLGWGYDMRYSLLLQWSDACWVCLVPQEAFMREALLLPPDHSSGHVSVTHGRMYAQANGAQQHDARAPRTLLHRVPIGHEKLKSTLIRGGDYK